MKKMQAFVILLVLALLCSEAWAIKKKVAQSGMTYLAISLSARESAMGDASVAAVRGIQGSFYNPAVLADIDRFSICFNQVNWLVDTYLYGVAAAYRVGQLGTVGVDMVYMDYGRIVGTRVVDKSIDYHGYVITGDLAVEEWALGLTLSHRISDRFSIGMKLKYMHEDLGSAAIVVDEITDPESGAVTKIREERGWSLDNWGLDVGTMYYTGFKSLAVAMSMQNFSTDMKYWYEEFQLPMCLRIGLAMDVADFFMEDSKDLDVLLAVDALHSNDYTERIHVGSEVVLFQLIALRGGYKFNHDVESYSFGVGVNFRLGGLSSSIDYSFTGCDYFRDVNRFSIQFHF